MRQLWDLWLTIRKQETWLAEGGVSSQQAPGECGRTELSTEVKLVKFALFSPTLWCLTQQSVLQLTLNYSKQCSNGLVTLKQPPQSSPLHSHFLKAPWNEWSAAATENHGFLHLCKVEQAAVYSYLYQRELLMEMGQISEVLRAAIALPSCRSHHRDVPMQNSFGGSLICRVPAAGSGVAITIIWSNIMHYSATCVLHA